MFNHEPNEYSCPFCNLINDIESELNKKQDIIYENEFALAFIAPKWWSNNQGHVLVVPKHHYENIYDISEEALAEVYKTAKKVSIAIKSTYNCDGTSTRQHNEPAGNQDVWHFHTHVFPRYKDDSLYKKDEKIEFVSAEERLPYAKKLREFFENHS